MVYPQCPFKISSGQKLAVLYHDIFDYPLTKKELILWNSGVFTRKELSIKFKLQNGERYFFLSGREAIVAERLERKRISSEKFELARIGASLLWSIPSIKMVAVTGALAMGNAVEDSDVDLMIVTSKGTLWSTRLLSILFLGIKGIRVRRAGKSDQKDRLCLNIWLDEENLVWPKRDRNIYTAHELIQIKPIFDRGEVFRRLLEKNKWASRFWPNAYTKFFQSSVNSKIASSFLGEMMVRIMGFVDLEAYILQLAYMSGKRTREVVERRRALFHPVDWGSRVLEELEVWDFS